MHVFNIDLSLTFHLPGGPKAAFGSAVACGILLGVFEGVGVLLGRVFSEGTRPQLPPCESHVFGFFSGAHSHGCRHQYPSPCLRRRHHQLLSSSHRLLSLHPRPYNYPSRIVHCVALGRLVTLAHALIDTLCIPWPFLLTQYIISPV
jgi:hypothetical protein